MSFTIRRIAFDDPNVQSVKVFPYYNYGVCLRKFKDNTYELWNYQNIPISIIPKVLEEFLKETDIGGKLTIGDDIFIIPSQKDKIREELFEFLVEQQKSQLNDEEG